MKDYEKVFTLDPAAVACPHAAFAKARTETPVDWSEVLQAWVVSDHATSLSILRDSSNFSNRLLIGPVADAVWQRMFDVAREDEALRARLDSYGSTATKRKVLLFADPPDHTRDRALVNGALTKGALESWEDRIHELALEFVDVIVREQTVDFASLVWDFTITVMCNILGVPREDVPRVRQWADDFTSMVGQLPGASSLEMDRLAASQLEFDQYFHDQVDDRLTSPRDDLITRIATMNRDDEHPLERDALLGIFNNMIVGGTETSATMLAQLLQHLAQNPGRFSQLREDRTLVPLFIEEMLRDQGPIQGTFRTAVRDIEVGGHTIRENDNVWLSFHSANHDAAVFSDPTDLDLNRDTRKHLMFGQGPHHCVGANLARLELRTMLNLILTTFSEVRLADPATPVPRKSSFLFFGPAQLDLTFVPADS